MQKILPIFIGSIVLITHPASAQQDSGSTASQAAIQAYLEQQRQSSSHFGSMVQMQVDVQYGDVLDALSRVASHREEVQSILIEVISERGEMSSQATRGQITPEQLAQISSYEYLRHRLSNILNSTELQLLDSRQDGIAEEQLRKTYLDQMNRVSPEITEPNRRIVLNVLIKHMLFRGNNSDYRNQVTAEELVQQQLLSLSDARVEFQEIFVGEQLELVIQYLNELRSNLFLNQSMNN